MFKKKRYFLKKVSDKTKAKNKIRKEKLDVYYNTLINGCFFSENSGERIYNANKSNIAHLFDKSKHRSIEDNLNNYIYLTLFEHQDFDNLLFRHVFDKLERMFPIAWEIACGRMKQLIPLCEEKTRFYFAISDYLNVDN